MPHSHDRARVLGRFRLVGLWIPIALFAALAVVQMALLPRVPDHVAVHWDASGQADGFAAAWTYPLTTLILGLGTVLLIAGAALAGTRKSKTVDLRFISAITLGTAGFMGALMMWLFLLQVDVADPAAVSLGVWPVVGTLALGAALGFAGWKLTPRHESTDGDAVTPEPVMLRDSEKAAWLGTATLSGVGLGALAAGVVVVAGSVFLVLPSGDAVAIWATVGALLLVVVLGAASSVFRVRVDASGLTVRSVAGWPRFHVPASAVGTVEVVQVNPMGDFGGWGWRLSPTHGTGVVMRTGEALRVTRTDGRMFTVTIDDATTAAALPRGHQQRSHV